MESANPPLTDAGPSQPGRRAQKRKASGAQEGNSSQKKQKAQPRRPPPRAEKKGKATLADGNNAPELTPLPLSSGQPPIASRIRAALCDSNEFWRYIKEVFIRPTTLHPACSSMERQPPAMLSRPR